jgi:hypothetical protein
MIEHTSVRGMTTTLSLEAYNRLVDTAHEVSRSAVGRLRRLRDRFPGDIPGATVEFLERGVEDPTAERRRDVRVPGGVSALSISRTGRAAPEAAAVGDRSERGVGLLAESPAVPGVVLELRPAAPTDYPCSARARVRHCHAEGDRWWLGCELLDD